MADLHKKSRHRGADAISADAAGGEAASRAHVSFARTSRSDPPGPGGGQGAGEAPKASGSGATERKSALRRSLRRASAEAPAGAKAEAKADAGAEAKADAGAEAKADAGAEAKADVGAEAEAATAIAKDEFSREEGYSLLRYDDALAEAGLPASATVADRAALFDAIGSFIRANSAIESSVPIEGAISEVGGCATLQEAFPVPIQRMLFDMGAALRWVLFLTVAHERSAEEGDAPFAEPFEPRDALVLLPQAYDVGAESALWCHFDLSSESEDEDEDEDEGNGSEVEDSEADTGGAAETTSGLTDGCDPPAAEGGLEESGEGADV